ncbi:hypothetical protein GM661_07605 [Iocasia frigidifontis]|uniref:Nucleoside phosphorylase domain-containing protein n=1 Tax=Iocasia fonsfrigidae TaxID=2682810 RepID=A0A8A7K9G5_9FIRM|nr:hypothetical protein GM661_07605 [Iocasia fonsfrigidae]
MPEPKPSLAKAQELRKLGYVRRNNPSGKGLLKIKDWFNPNDDSKTIISAQEHIKSSHGYQNYNIKLGNTTLLFETGIAIPYIEENYDTSILIDKLPGFLYNPKCLKFKNNEDLNLIQGGYGSPAAIDTLETIIAMGTKRVVIFGMCGGIGKDLEVGDLIIPKEVIREEGTSYHYLKSGINSEPDIELLHKAENFFTKHYEKKTFTGKTVSTDAVYRQTINKEKSWREESILGIDMESSALLAVCSYYKIPAVSILIVSDKHNLDDKEDWNWGSKSFNNDRKKAIDLCIKFVAGYIV